MLRVLKSHSAAERILAATEFVRSFPPATELLIIGVSRDAVDDFIRGLAASAQATFGLHRFSLTQLAARLALTRLAVNGIAPGSAVGAEAIAVRAAYEAATRNQLQYFAHVPLDASGDQIRQLASLHARVLGADDRETEAASAAVQRALSHPLLQRAREAWHRGQLRVYWTSHSSRAKSGRSWTSRPTGS